MNAALPEFDTEEATGSLPDFGDAAPVRPPALQAKKDDLDKQMKVARAEGRLASDELTATDIAQRAVNTVSMMNPADLLRKLINPNGAVIVPPEQMRRFLYPAGGQSKPGSVEGAISDFIVENASGMTSPDALAALAAGKVSPAIPGRYFQAQMIPQSGEAAGRLAQAKTPGEAVKAGLETAASVGFPLAIEAGLAPKAAPEIPLNTGRVLPPRTGAVPSPETQAVEAVRANAPEAEILPPGGELSAADKARAAAVFQELDAASKARSAKPKKPAASVLPAEATPAELQAQLDAELGQGPTPEGGAPVPAPKPTPKPTAPAEEAAPMVTEATVDKLPLADQGKLKHATGMEYGVTLTEADLPRLEEKYKASSEAMKKAFASGDSPAQLAAFGQMNFYGGALMGASRGKHPISGSNFERFAKERAAQGRTIPEPKPAAAPAPSAEVTVTEHPTGFKLSGIGVPLEHRGKGIGTAAMKELMAKADAAGKPIYLTASAEAGQQARLNKFYEALGFEHWKDDPLNGKPMYRRLPKGASAPAAPAPSAAPPGAITPRLTDAELAMEYSKTIASILDFGARGEQVPRDVHSKAQDLLAEINRRGIEITTPDQGKKFRPATIKQANVSSVETSPRAPAPAAPAPSAAPVEPEPPPAATPDFVAQLIDTGMAESKPMGESAMLAWERAVANGKNGEVPIEHWVKGITDAQVTFDPQGRSATFHVAGYTEGLKIAHETVTVTVLDDGTIRMLASSGKEPNLLKAAVKITENVLRGKEKPAAQPEPQKQLPAPAAPAPVTPAPAAPAPAPAAAPKAEAAAIAAKQQQDLFGAKSSPAPKAIEQVLWGRRDGGEWVKLTDNVSEAEKSRRRKDGWEVQSTAKGEKPAPTGIGGGIKRAQQQGRQGEAGFVTIPQGVTEAVTKAADYVSQIIREEFDAPKMTDRRRAILNWSAKLQRSFGEAAAKQRDILKRVPKALHRDGITNWIQANGNKYELAHRRYVTARWRDPATGKPHPDAKRLIAGYDAALRLTPEEIAVANEVKADYARFAARGQGADVLDQLKDNYVTQTWNLRKGPAGTGSSRTLKERFRFSRARTFVDYLEGEQAGYSPKTKDISKLLPMYSHEMNAVIAAREMVAEMGQGVASDGRPLLAPKGIGIPVDDPTKGQATLVMPKVSGKDIKDYKVLANQPALSGWKWVSKDSAGNPVMLKADLALHPEAYKHLQAVLGRSAIRDWYGTRTTALAEIPKALVHGIDWANSETKRTMLGMLATFHQVQTGTHAIGHRVNPFFSIPKVDLVGNAAQMDAARHGLMLLQDRASADQFMEGFKTSGLVSRIPGIGPLSDWYSNYLFSEYIPGLKYKTYQAILERNLKVYDKQITSGRVSGADVKVLSAEQANAAYGHLNYADLGRNPTIQHIAQLGLLAPDFLEARGRFAGHAIKGTTGAKVGREQLLALATLALAQGALAYTSAKISGGEWDKKRPFEFTLGNRRYTVRSVPEDMQNLLTNTRQFVHSRLSPIIGKGSLQYATGVDYRGRKISAGQTTKELAQQPIPLSVRGFAGIGQSTLSGMEQLAGAIGLRISRYSPMMDMHDLIVDFKKSSTDPRVKADVEIQEQEVFASHYEKLRNALHSGDLAGARKEYDKLDGIRTPKQIDAAMKPWTGGNFNQQTLDVSPRRPKPFTGSAKNERDFLATLTPEQRQTYQKATAERAQQYQAFKNMLQQAPTPSAGALPEF